jgi:hypothetical protein
MYNISKAALDQLTRFQQLQMSFFVSSHSNVLLNLKFYSLLSRVGKNPGFFKKTQPSGFFWVFLGFFGFFWVFLPGREGF